MLTGHCLCGDVHVEIDGKLGSLAYCHCDSCRRASGTAFGSLFRIRLGLVDGDPKRRPVAHFFVSEKAPWHEIVDALPQHPAEIPGGEPVADAS